MGRSSHGWRLLMSGTIEFPGSLLTTRSPLAIFSRINCGFIIFFQSEFDVGCDIVGLNEQRVLRGVPEPRIDGSENLRESLDVLVLNVTERGRDFQAYLQMFDTCHLSLTGHTEHLLVGITTPCTPIFGGCH